MERIFKGFEPIEQIPEQANTKYHHVPPQFSNAKTYCTTCGNEANQIAIFQGDGVTMAERYCQACIDAKKHLNESQLMIDFDKLFIRAKPRD